MLETLTRINALITQAERDAGEAATDAERSRARMRRNMLQVARDHAATYGPDGRAYMERRAEVLEARATGLRPGSHGAHSFPVEAAALRDVLALL
jgi:hypothetical protein